MAELSKADLDELVEEAIVDAYGEEEQLAGFYTMFEENLVLPFTTMVLGVGVTVERIDPLSTGLGVDQGLWALGGAAMSEYQYYEFLAVDRLLTTG
jgi:Calcium binding